MIDQTASVTTLPRSVERLPLSDGAWIAYRRLAATDCTKPTTVVFTHGLRSNMDGSKAQVVEDYCREQGRGSLRFDCSGHGHSSGKYEDGTISRWTDDALAAIDALTDGPLVLVGSSMGGWLSLLCALKRPQRVKGLLGIAPAPDFIIDLTEDEEQAIERDGRIVVKKDSSEHPYIFTRDFLKDARANQLLNGEIAFNGPVRVLQGQKDDSVPWSRPFLLMDRLTSKDVETQLIKNGDHRLSTPEDLERLQRTLDELLQRVEA